MPTDELARGPALREMAAFSNLFTLVFSTLPIPLSGGHRSDGFQLLRLPWLGREQLTEALMADLYLDAWDALEGHDADTAERLARNILEKHPSSQGAESLLSLVDLERGLYASARDRIANLLAKEGAPALDRPQRLALQNNLAWTYFMLDDTAHRDEAERLSVEVLDAAPSVSFALGTRGAVLLWREYYGEACDLLERAHLVATSPVSRANNACCLAIAHSNMGDSSLAHTWLERARRDDPRCSLLARAQAAIDSAPAGAATSSTLRP